MEALIAKVLGFLVAGGGLWWFAARPLKRRAAVKAAVAELDAAKRRATGAAPRLERELVQAAEKVRAGRKDAAFGAEKAGRATEDLGTILDRHGKACLVAGLALCCAFWAANASESASTDDCAMEARAAGLAADLERVAVLFDADSKSALDVQDGISALLASARRGDGLCQQVRGLKVELAGREQELRARVAQLELCEATEAACFKLRDLVGPATPGTCGKWGVYSGVGAGFPIYQVDPDGPPPFFWAGVSVGRRLWPR